MIEANQLIRLALQTGFSSAAVVKTRDIPLDSSFREYCQENLCGDFGANHSCPPDCGTPEEMAQKLWAWDRALVLRTVWDLPDWQDYPKIESCRAVHNRQSLVLKRELAQLGLPSLMAGCSGCTLCTPCLKSKGEACPYPEDQYSCLSAYCVYVLALARMCGMEYNAGKGKLAFFSLLALN